MRSGPLRWVGLELPGWGGSILLRRAPLAAWAGWHLAAPPGKQELGPHAPPSSVLP